MGQSGATEAVSAEWLLVYQAAKRLGISSARLRGMMRRGALTWRRLPGSVAEVKASDVERMLRECEVTATRTEPVTMTRPGWNAYHPRGGRLMRGKVLPPAPEPEAAPEPEPEPAD